MTYLIALILNFIVLSFFGYWVHRFFHSKLSGILYTKHQNHHFLQYPPENFYSDKYRDAGKDNSALLFLLAFSPLAAILIWLMLSEHVSIYLGLSLAAEAIIFGWLNDNLHDSFHLNKSIWQKFPFFSRLVKLHYQHHIDVQTNFGIFSFWLDRIFKTFEDVK